jgi:hypothetical protein
MQWDILPPYQKVLGNGRLPENGVIPDAFRTRISKTGQGISIHVPAWSAVQMPGWRNNLPWFPPAG